jgi:AAT family amino acid transporter
MYSLVGVSNQLSWIAIGIASLRFRAAVKLQGKEHLLPFKNWTYPWGPWCSIILNSFLVLIQGWSCFSPRFDAVSFVSFYIELPIMVVMYIGWKVFKGTRFVGLRTMDLEVDRYEDVNAIGDAGEGDWKRKGKAVLRWLI